MYFTAENLQVLSFHWLICISIEERGYIIVPLRSHLNGHNFHLFFPDSCEETFVNYVNALEMRRRREHDSNPVP